MGKNDFVCLSNSWQIADKNWSLWYVSLELFRINRIETNSKKKRAGRVFLVPLKLAPKERMALKQFDYSKKTNCCFKV